MFKPCVIIPVFNHHLNIESIVESILEQELTCILLDDGSDIDCKNTLSNLAQKHNVKLLRWEKNRGKGAVVCDGIKYAHLDGYTHALQIDADGQHNTNDIPKLIKKAKNNPSSVISAWRAYSDMPKSRRNGRRITDLWVWINTLSLCIKDSMCGLRMYPLKETYDLLTQHSVCQRMDFDTDILVRLYWKGLDVKHIQTHTTYSNDISSHFKLWNDNLRISKMHTRLFFGMLVRIPSLISRQIQR